MGETSAIYVQQYKAELAIGSAFLGAVLHFFTVTVLVSSPS